MEGFGDLPKHVLNRSPLLNRRRPQASDVYVYQRKDLMAVVEDAAGELTRKGKYLV